MLELDTTLLKDLYQPSSTRPRRAKTLIGQKFERLTPYGLVGIHSSGDAIWLCRCDCGNFILTKANTLRRGHKTSCGEFGTRQFPCFSPKYHGMSRTVVYQRWASMMSRCYNPNCKQYADWGGRGITVEDRWHIFENFYNDMGEPPTSKHEINRLNNDGNYGPINCIWDTKTNQARNTRANTYYTIGDETFCVAEWAERSNIKKYVVYSRLQAGWSIEEALDKIQRTRFLGVYTVYLTANGETRALPDWAKLRGLTKSAIRNRLARGWTHEQALGFQSPPPRSRWTKRAH